MPDPKGLLVKIWLRALLPQSVAGEFRYPPQLLLAGAASVCVLAIHAPTIASALTSGTGSNYEFTEAVLAPLTVLWLIWSRRKGLRQLTLHPWWPGAVGVMFAAALWMLADLVNINVLRQFAVVAMLQALVPAVLGLTAARALALPLLFLLFAVDVSSPLLTTPLMQWSADLTVVALRLTGVSVILDEMAIITPFGRWQIIEGCSAVNYVLIYAMAGTLFASLGYRSIGRRVAFVVASLIAALLANVLREWAVVFIANVSDGFDPDHSVIGWMSFAAVFALMLTIGQWFSGPLPESRERELPAPAPKRGSARGSALAAVIVVAIVGAAPVTMAAVQNHFRRSVFYDGCRVLERFMVEQDGTPGIRTRSECSGPSGRRQLHRVAETILHAVAPEATLVTGRRRIDKVDQTGGIDAATLTTIDAKVPYRLTYWYEVGNVATGNWLGLKWHLAFALLANGDVPVTVVSDLQEL